MKVNFDFSEEDEFFIEEDFFNPQTTPNINFADAVRVAALEILKKNFDVTLKFKTKDGIKKYVAIFIGKETIKWEEIQS